MLPKTTLARGQMNKLKVYAGPEHPHAAQKPQPFEITQVDAERPGQVGDAGGRQHTDVNDVDARTGQAGDDSCGQELPRGSRVAPDHGTRPMPVEGARGTEHVRRGDRHVERQLGSHLAVGNTTYPVGTEQAPHPDLLSRAPTVPHPTPRVAPSAGRTHQGRERPRPRWRAIGAVGRVPVSAVSAWSTAVPCGPSSGRPSCARRRAGRE